MPSMASTSCAMISGRSGLPKFRLLVAATGIAPDGRQVAAALGHRELRALARIEIAVAPVAVERHRDARAGLLDAHDRRIAAGPAIVLVRTM